MSERGERYWGPYPGEVPLSRASRPAAPPEPEPEARPEPEAQREQDPQREAEADPGPEPQPRPRPERPSGPDPSSGTEPPARVAERAPTRAERRRDGNAMVPVLAQALSSQLTRLAADVDPVPDGWWFTPQR